MWVRSDEGQGAALVRIIPTEGYTAILHIIIQVARRHAEACGAGVVDGLHRRRRDIIACARLLRIPHIIIRGCAGFVADIYIRLGIILYRKTIWNTVSFTSLFTRSMEPLCWRIIWRARERPMPEPSFLVV